MRSSFALTVIAASTLLSTEARATYSIAATSSATGEVGGAGTSCVGRFSVYRIYTSSPGHGVAMAQASVNEGGRDVAQARLATDVAPSDILAEITGASFDPDSARRQYGVVDLAGRAAGFTGGGTLDFASDMQGSIGPVTYSVQGNILTSRRVLEQAEAAMRGPGCDLAERLMLALEAGAQNGEGDSRCTPNGIPSDGAFLQVDRAGERAGNYLLLRVDDAAPANPLVLLRAEFDRWRATHPCGAGGPVDAGVSADAAPLTDAAPLADAEVAEAGAPPDLEMEGAEGCQCADGRSTPPFAWAMSLAGAASFVARGRRRQAATGTASSAWKYSAP